MGCQLSGLCVTGASGILKPKPLVEEMMDGAVFEVIIADNLPSCKELRARTEMVAA